MYLIDSENLTKIKLTTEQFTEAKRLIDDGEVTESLWEGTIMSSDYIDGDGDFCCDEEMYDNIKEHLKL